MIPYDPAALRVSELTSAVHAAVEATMSTKLTFENTELMRIRGIGACYVGSILASERGEGQYKTILRDSNTAIPVNNAYAQQASSPNECRVSLIKCNA